MPGDVFSVFNNNRPTPAGPPTPAVSTTDPNTATANNSVTLPTNNATVTNPNTVSPTPSGDGTAVAQNSNQLTQANTNAPGPATDNPTQKVGDAVIVQNPTPTDPGTQQPRTLQGQVDATLGTNPFTNAVTRFTDGLAGAQAAGKVITDTIASLSQEARQQIVDAFNKFNEGTSLVEPSDRLNGSAIGILEGLGVVPNVQIADSGSSTGFTPLREALDNNSSQAFQESRQAGNTIGFGLPFVLEGGGAGKPPASSPELVPVGPGGPITSPLESPVATPGNPLFSQANNNPNNGETPVSKPTAEDYTRLQGELKVSDETRGILEKNGIDPERVRVLDARGVSPEDLAVYVSESGAKGGETIGGLISQKVPENVAQQLVRTAEAQNVENLSGKTNVLDTVNDIVKTGKLQNPQSLAGKIDEIQKEFKEPSSPPTFAPTFKELEDVAARTALGNQVKLGGGGDVTDLTAQQVIQHKDISSPDPAKLTVRINDANGQLSGAGGEVPPNRQVTDSVTGAVSEVPYTRIADVRINNSENGLFNADRTALDNFLRDAVKVDQLTLESTDEIRITNGLGTQIFKASDFQ